MAEIMKDAGCRISDEDAKAPRRTTVAAPKLTLHQLKLTCVLAPWRASLSLAGFGWRGPGGTAMSMAVEITPFSSYPLL